MFVLGVFQTTSVPEEHHESVDLDDHSDERPSHEDDDDATEECGRPLRLVPLEEEPERPLQADHEGQAAQEQDLKREEGMEMKMWSVDGFAV